MHFWGVRLSVAFACAAVLTSASWAQVAEVRPVVERADGVTYEINIRWPSTLQQVVDSTGAAALTVEFAMAASGGVLYELKKLDLPAFALPQVRIVGAEYDEVMLPLAEGADTLVALLGNPLAEAVGLGWERKRPAATLLMRLLAYEPSSASLRRYRRMLVEVDYGRVSQAAGGLSSRLSTFASSSNPHLAVNASVLSDGHVFKLPVTEEGIYRIDRTYLDNLLKSVGLSIANVQPNQIKVYGNGGAPLPALNSASRPADLVQVPVLVRTNAQGFTDLLFYGRGPQGWQYDAQSGVWEHFVHPFSSENYYFIKIDTGTEAGMRVQGGAFPGYPDARRLASVTGRAFRDFDDVMWSHDGRGGHTWVSRQIRTYESLDVLTGVSIPGPAAGTVRYQARVAVRSNPAASVTFLSGNATLARLTAGRVTPGTEYPVASTTQGMFQQTISDGQPLGLTMKVEGQSSGSIEPQAALDWIRVSYPQALRAEDGYLRFVTPAGETGRLEFVLNGFSQPPTVWDVTDHNAIRALGVQAEANAYVVQVEVTDPARPREIVAFADAAAQPVPPAMRIQPQNLHGIQTYPEFVIVVPDTFRVYAEELAQYRRDRGLSVEVVDVREIYNEFSGGLPDMRALRDYFKFLYDRAPDESRMLRYALLFGDGHYNYRNLEQKPELNNWIFPYETEETFDPEKSYTSDDYFGLLDDTEGEWLYGYNQFVSEERVDIGIGRFPVQTVADAQTAVNKIKHYEDPTTYGPWRTRYAFLADDHLTGLSGSKNEQDLHTQNADVVAEVVRAAYPEVDVRKIYAISYDRVFSGMWKIPAARKDMLAALNDGVLCFNYSGHGGIDALAQEELFTRGDAAELRNYDHLPIFITATCSFGRWDMDDIQSAAEIAFNNPGGGAVALFTTVRTVVTWSDPLSLNLGLNRQLNIELFKRDEQGLPRRLGDVLRETKNTRVGLQGNNRKFSLLGDPTMRLGVPSGHAIVENVNSVGVDTQHVKLPAFEHVTISGEVRRPDGHLDESFNGTVYLTVYDAERRVDIEEQRHMSTPYYVVQEDLLWRGEVTATGGRYQAEFVMPKDISYSNKPGRISVYARSNDAQALGFTKNVVIGGSSANPPDDAEGPQIALFLNDTTFVSGGLTTPQPELIMRLFDQSGINTVGTGVGHEMLLTVDGDDARAVNLSNEYESEGNSYQRGRVRYDLRDYLVQHGEEALTPGPHTLTVKAWDVLNNSTAATLDFYVAASEDLTLRNIYNYPNPMVSSTQFVFEHNQPSGTPAEVQIRIYTLSGRPVKTIEMNEVLPGGLVQIPWDGLDDDFDRLATGVYLYKLRVKVDQPDGGNQVAERVERLAVIR